MRDAIKETLDYYEGSGRYVMVDAALHREQGVCVWSPEFVLMARPVDSFDVLERVVDPLVGYDSCFCDAWHVHWMAGDMKRLRDIEAIIRLFPFVTFERQKRGKRGLWRMGHEYYSLLFR